MKGNETTEHIIREAVTDDAAVLAAFAERAFRDTYSDANDPANMDLYVSDNFSSSKFAAELSNPAFYFFIAADDEDKIIGYAKLKAGEPNPCVTKPAIELERIYVDDSAKGRGIGSSLLRKCIQRSIELGFPTMWLGVWGENHPALEFYRRFGFDVLGTHAFVLGEDVQTDLVMGKAL